MKFHGAIGFSSTIESPANSGIWIEQTTERDYYGDVLQNYRKWDSAQTLNDNFGLDNRISVLADSYLKSNVQRMRYVKMDGAVWEISRFEIQRPRIIISLGGIYNGPTPSASANP